MVLDQPRPAPNALPVARAASPRTFLIADVRGYTHYTERHGAAAAAHLATRFATLVREGLAGADGELLGLRGDEAAVAFGSPEGAVRAALALQARFARATAADPTLPLLVGMGLDTGEAVPVADGYRGMALNVAARLCALAGPGQALLTPEVAASATRRDLAYVERGTAALKGLSAPVRVLQALPTGFAALLAAPADAEVAERVRLDLAAAGVACWTERPLPGAEADPSPRAALRSAGLVVALVSPQARPSRHVKAALRLTTVYERAVIPLWVAGLDATDCLPSTLDAEDLIDARAGQYAGAVAALVERLERQRARAQMADHDPAAGAHAPEPEREAPRNPYKGLRAFGEGDTGDFFGRDAVVEELRAALAAVLAAGEARLLAVTGPSGSGKSSLIHAGLAPRLKEGAVPGSASWRYLGPLFPGMRPMDALAAALAAHDNHEGRDGAAPIRASLEGDSALGLHRRAQQLVTSPGDRVLLIIDQAEELFLSWVGMGGEQEKG